MDGLGHQCQLAHSTKQNVELTAGWVIWKKDALISNHWTHTSTIATVAVVPTRAARTEVQAVSAGRVRQVLRGEPIEAVRAGIEEVGDVAAARCRQEDAVAVDFARELAPFNTIDLYPFCWTIVKQFPDLLKGRHPPIPTPFHMCHVVFRAGNVAAQIMAGILVAIAVGVGFPIVIVLFHCLAPCEIAAALFRLGGTNIAGSPLRARGQAQVDGLTRKFCPGT